MSTGTLLASRSGAWDLGQAKNVLVEREKSRKKRSTIDEKIAELEEESEDEESEKDEDEEDGSDEAASEGVGESEEDSGDVSDDGHQDEGNESENEYEDEDEDGALPDISVPDRTREAKAPVRPPKTKKVHLLCCLCYRSF